MQVSLNENKEMIMVVPVSDQFLADVLCTAVESGYSTSWAAFSKVKQEDPKDIVSNYIEVTVEDMGDEEEAQSSKVITLPMMREGLAKLVAGTLTSEDDGDPNVHETYRHEILSAVIADDAGEIDAWRADMILQAAYFGAVIYG